MWSMPRNVLQVVAVLIGLCAFGGFALGFSAAPQRGRLPGEAAAGSGVGAPLAAADARPLSLEEEVTPAQQAPVEEEEEEEAAPPPKVAPIEAPKPAPLAVPPPVPAEKAGDQATAAPPADDEPPH